MTSPSSTATAKRPSRRPTRRALRRFARLPSVALVLALVWIPYSLIHCPSCASAATSPFHCLFASSAPAPDARKSETHDHCHRNARDADSAEGAPERSSSRPEGACCAVQPAPAAPTAHPSDLLPAPILVATLPTPSETNESAHPLPVGNQESPSGDAHAPPRYVLFRTLIL